MPYTAEKAVVRYSRDIKEIAIIKSSCSCLDSQSSRRLSSWTIWCSWVFRIYRSWVFSNSSREHIYISIGYFTHF